MDINQLYEAIDLQHISDYVANGQEEHLTLDFKTVSNANLKGEDDKRNFAKALSGFANSSGGLIVWGVDARKNSQGVDCAVEAKPISSLRLFISRLNELTGSFVNPLVDGVVHRGVEIESDTGFAITLVPASNSGPHMAKAGEDRYYKRNGASFYRLEHFDLEDMFGRRPRPNLVPVVKTEFSYSATTGGWTVAFDILNEGRGTAKHVCIEFPWQGGMKEAPSLWAHVQGAYDPTSRHHSLMFELPAPRVIHPGMTIGFQELHLAYQPFQPGDTTALECKIYCEGCAPASHVIQGKLRQHGK